MMRFFDHDGLRLSYLDAGRRVPLVFQHGLGGDAEQTASQAPAGARLITLECRGHGTSHPLGPAGALTFDTFTRDLAALLDELGVRDAIVGGISMGAGVASALARLRPELVRALVLVRPAWSDRPNPPHLRVLTEIARLLQDHPAEVARELFVRRSPAYRRIRAQSPAAGASLLAQFDRPRAREHADVLARLPADCPAGPPADRPIPTLILAARRDPLHPFETAMAVRRGFRDAELQEIPAKDPDGARQRAAVADAIGAFIDAQPVPTVTAVATEA